jgi:phage shock protein PspC (stress-responsive transcriptional regulator)
MLFVFALLFAGGGLLVYIILYFILPEEQNKEFKQ